MGSLLFTRVPISVEEEAYYVDAAIIDPDLLRTLRVSPVIGTDFEGVRDFDDTVIISHRLWQSAFAGAGDVIGKPIIIGGGRSTVRGVLPPDFEVPRTDARFYRGPVDVFLPAAANYVGGNDWAIGRLAPGVSIEEAEAELRSIVAALGHDNSANHGWTVRLSPLEKERTRNAMTALAVLLAIGAVLLLIACTNLVNLLFARGAARTQEIAVRQTLGATSRRLVRQQLTESLCVAMLGGIVGIAMAAVGVRGFSALSPLRLPIIQGITLDGRVLGFFPGECRCHAHRRRRAGDVLDPRRGGLGGRFDGTRLPAHAEAVDDHAGRAVGRAARGSGRVVAQPLAALSRGSRFRQRTRARLRAPIRPGYRINRYDSFREHSTRSNRFRASPVQATSRIYPPRPGAPSMSLSASRACRSTWTRKR